MRAFSMSVETCGTKARFATPYRVRFQHGTEGNSNKELSAIQARNRVRPDGIDYYNEQTARITGQEGGGDSAGRGGLSVGRVAGTGAAGHQ
jgi:hypothetical protein